MKNILLILFLLLGISLTPVLAPPVYACDNFDFPKDIVAANETFQITVTDVTSGYNYALYYGDSSGANTIVPGTQQTASSTSLTFTVDASILPVNQLYNFRVEGVQGNDTDRCSGNGSVFVEPNESTAPIESGWILNGNNECVEEETSPEFESKEDCEAAIALTEEREASLANGELPPPPLPPCAEWEIEGEKCAAVSSGIGDLNTAPQNFVQTLFRILMSISGGIALILIISSGYQIMTSQGDPEKIKAGRERFISAIVGLLFLIFSLVILEIIGVNILRIPGFTS